MCRLAPSDACKSASSGICKLAPSILAADFADLGSCITKVEAAGADYLHIDVMDGSFVPSISFGTPVISSIRKVSKMIFDVHLMVREPIRYIADFADSGADIITVHAEACTHLDRTISEIHACGKKAGIALNPATSLSVLDYTLQDADLILVMSVNPGFGGQKFLPSTLSKLRKLRYMMKELNCCPEVEVDGGITIHNLLEIRNAGANVFVAGTSVFSGTINENISKFKQTFLSINDSVYFK